MWFTDDIGQNSVGHNLEEMFDVLNNFYNLYDLENCAIDILVDSKEYLKLLMK